MVPRKETSRTDYTSPTGYTLVGVTQIDGESYAMLATMKSSVTTPGLGAGVGEVFDCDGRLIMRYQASERAESPWDVIEYVRLPVANSLAGLAEK